MIIPCPRCSAGLTGAPQCASCGLPLTGPVAGELWTVDQRLGQVDRQLVALQAERRGLWTQHVHLLATLGQQAPATLPRFGAPTAPRRPPAPPVAPVGRPRQEWTPRRVQNLLLSLGAVLLVIAGAIFTAVSWRHLGAAVRGSILLALTAAGALGARALTRRGLGATAEAVAGVCVGLGAFDAYAFHALALPDVTKPSYWTVATAVLAVAAAGLARLAGVRLAAIASALLTLTPLLVACSADHTQATRSLLVSADALVAVIGLVALRRTGLRQDDVRRCWQGGAALLGTLGFAATGTHILYGLAGQPLGVVVTAVLLCGLAAGLAAVLEAEDATARTWLSGAAALCLLCALGLPFEATLDLTWWAVALTGCALAVGLGAALLPTAWQRGPALTAAVGAALAAGSDLPSVLDTVGCQLAWAVHPWTASGHVLGRYAQDALWAPPRWTGPANLVALLLAAAVAVVVGEVVGRRTQAAYVAVGLVAMTLAVAVPQLDGPWVAGLGAEVALAAAAAAFSAWAMRRGHQNAALGGLVTSILASILGLSWALALPSTTVVVAASVVAILVGAALAGVPYRPVVVAAAVLASGYAVAGAARSGGAPVVACGPAIAAVPLSLTVALAVRSRWFGGRPSLEADAAEVAALLVCAGALVVSATDPAWQGRSLLVASLAVLVGCVRPERRRGLALGVAAAGVGLTQLPINEHLASSALTGCLLGLCTLSIGLAWLLAESLVDRRSPELLETLGVLGAGSLVQALVAVSSASSRARDLAVALTVITALYAAVAALPEAWWTRRGVGVQVRSVATAVATAALVGTVAAATDAAAWRAPAIGLAVAVTASLLAAGATWLRDRQPDSSVVEVVAALAALPALVACAGRPAYAGWVLGLAGLSVLLSAATRPERRAAWPVGAQLCASATWTWLWVAGIASPEPYTDPIALVALWAGLHRRRNDPATTSLVAYGPGLSGLLLPSLAFALTGEGVDRPLLLAALATGIVVLGAQHRLRAPLLLGSATLVLTALRLLAPYETLVPRWLEVGTAGALLLTLGATYEQRRRDLHELRARYDALA